MKKYIKPSAELFEVKANQPFAESFVINPGSGSDAGESFSKDTSWEDDDDLDGGSAIW